MSGTRGTSRLAIHAAATELFAERGYANTPVRDIASSAGVDAALVIRHFGSKEKLFIDTMRSPSERILEFEPPLATLAERIVRFVLETDDHVRNTYVALVRASDAAEVASVLREVHEETFVAPLREILAGDDRDLRARLVASMVGGLMYSLWTVGDEGLRGASVDDLVGVYAPALQRLITP